MVIAIAAVTVWTLAAAPRTPAGTSSPPTWPDRQWLIDSLVKMVPAILQSQDPKTGRFGSPPWVCQDQNVIFPLAVAWKTQSPVNPFFRDKNVLQAIAKGGNALVDAQDEQGRWIFRKKDNTASGHIHMPWTYSRWIRAYQIVSDELPDDTSARWQEGLRKGFIQIRKYANGHVHNIPTHHAMALYIAGKCFGVADWRQAAQRYMATVVKKQSTEGYWSENFGPVVGYNHVYIEALGIYYVESEDRTVLPALERAARFHAGSLWPDGSAIAAIDERQAYHAKRNIGNVGFSHTALGRGYLLAQTRTLRENGDPVPADYAAAMLEYGSTGTAEVPPGLGDGDRLILGNNKALVQRRKPWQFCLSAYSCPVPRNRWIQDRQNFLDVFHDELGLVVGGGNTKLQPYWSTFTVGDPAALRSGNLDRNPDFRPHVPLCWVPTRTQLVTTESDPTLELHYHRDVARVTASPQENGTLKLVYTATPKSGEHIEGHVPIMKRTGRIMFASGHSMYLLEDNVLLSHADTGGCFEWNGLKMTIPEGASLKWPCRQFDPYAKDGRAPLGNAKLVMILPISDTRRTYEVTLSRVRRPPFKGLVFGARTLPVVSPTGTRMKPLDNLDAFFLGATRRGESMTFSIGVPHEGIYEVLADFVLFHRYGMVTLAVDGMPLGEPFDAYAPELDSSGPVSFGIAQLKAGNHTINVKVVDKNPASERCFVSVKQFLLKPRASE